MTTDELDELDRHKATVIRDVLTIHDEELLTITEFVDAVITCLDEGNITDARRELEHILVALQELTVPARQRKVWRGETLDPDGP